jgi:hypothetical protein
VGLAVNHEVEDFVHSSAGNLASPEQFEGAGAQEAPGVLVVEEAHSGPLRLAKEPDRLFAIVEADPADAFPSRSAQVAVPSCRRADDRHMLRHNRL